MASYPSPIQEHGREGEDGFDYYAGDVSPSGCGCFCLKWWRNGGNRAHPYMQRRNGDGDGDGSWAVSTFKKAREFTEVVAGPKWKNFVRKVGGYWRSDKKRSNNSRFGYDAESYALNFDGGDDGAEEDGLLMKGVSARFVGSIRNDQERQAGIGLS